MKDGNHSEIGLETAVQPAGKHSPPPLAFQVDAEGFRMSNDSVEGVSDQSFARSVARGTHFRESREDLTVRASSRGAVEVRRTATAGWCIENRAALGDLSFASEGPPEPRLSADAAIAALERILDLFAARSPGAEALARWVSFEQKVWVARAPSPAVDDARSGWRIRVDARLREGASISLASAEIARGPRPDAHDSRIDALVDGLVERLERRFDRRRTPAGEHPVVLAPGVGGVLVHEIVGHALEADTVLAGRSWLACGESPPIAPEVRILDDPALARAAWRFDDEGAPAAAATLVADGGVAGLLHDSVTAERCVATTTGHGRRASFRDPVRPRMACTYVAAGALDPADVISHAENGIYVRRMEAGTVDPRTGRAVFRVTDADRIAGGALEASLDPFVLHVEGPRVLRELRWIADDLAFDTCVGSCHHHGQTLITSVGAPTVWVGSCAVVP